MKDKKIGLLIGSLRTDSFNKKMANAFMEETQYLFETEIIEIGNLSLYNQDYDENPPAEYKKFREQIKSCDAILFFTPEYNRSIPGVLKNAIDIASRPYGMSAWAKKPAGVISVSPGSIGGFGANHHLRQTLVFLDMPVMQQPEMYISNAGKIFNEEGKLSDEQVKGLLKKFVEAFDQWTSRFLPDPVIKSAREAEIMSQARH